MFVGVDVVAVVVALSVVDVSVVVVVVGFVVVNIAGCCVFRLLNGFILLLLLLLWQWLLFLPC